MNDFDIMDPIAAMLFAGLTASAPFLWSSFKQERARHRHPLSRPHEAVLIGGGLAQGIAVFFVLWVMVFHGPVGWPGAGAEAAGNAAYLFSVCAVLVMIPAHLVLDRGPLPDRQPLWIGGMDAAALASSRSLRSPAARRVPPLAREAGAGRGGSSMLRHRAAARVVRPTSPLHRTLARHCYRTR